ncbi:hypothetical protein GZ78_25405 [Endozoicomonas numazuensis]|uniref:Uncharacterized protein n=1 Tax=Endozoicomonas numazuensis TaxID=1137799 RepID=A0A081N6A7_9GAMM|nr:hypothetical protein GZ78_25405 [Endozoicomonas numazuensis]
MSNILSIGLSQFPLSFLKTIKQDGFLFILFSHTTQTTVPSESCQRFSQRIKPTDHCEHTIFSVLPPIFTSLK